MRHLILDTETTGLDPATGDRVIEIAAVELVNLVPTGRHFHALVDPERDIPEEATRIHGFSRADLLGKPRFHETAAPLLAFLGDGPIVAHNAGFDFGFLDHEFRLAGLAPLPRTRMTCSLELAKRRFPGLPNSLDALCRRFGIDCSMRTTHNALLDVRLLAEVFLELMGGRQPALLLAAAGGVRTIAGAVAMPRTPRRIAPTEAELLRHAAFIGRLKDPVWRQTEASVA